MKVKYLTSDNDKKALDVDNFWTVLSLNWADRFGDAKCKLVTNRQERLRQAAQVPNDNDVAKVWDHTISAMQDLCARQQYTFWTSYEFVQLCNLLVLQLTSTVWR